MRRQGLIITTKQLRKLADDLDRQQIRLWKHLKIKGNHKTKWLVNIINKTPFMSDTWEIEEK